eukprot:TRINITY_DN10151_c0_g1_i1.p1 TRINITY_DN10151_c0_g1~~TRINITY_DN10151_c0_g1_i1.p1  ORF type:complete len:199 (-),score=12.74 TRINITY_DN10151_c0_g1_i1:331-927(-)
MGYSIDLFSNKGAAESFICTLCLDVASNPMFVGDCEHFMCNDCVKGIDQCPFNCNTPFHPRNPNPGFLRPYNALKLSCNLCGLWEGSLGDLSTHHNKECLLFTISCPHRHRGCQIKQPRNNMNEIHSQICSQRVLPCPHCESQFTHNNLKNDHLKSCEMYPVKCRNHGDHQQSKECCSCVVMKRFRCLLFVRYLTNLF